MQLRLLVGVIAVDGDPTVDPDALQRMRLGCAALRRCHRFGSGEVLIAPAILDATQRVTHRVTQQRRCLREKPLFLADFGVFAVVEIPLSSTTAA